MGSGRRVAWGPDTPGYQRACGYARRFVASKILDGSGSPAIIEEALADGDDLLEATIFMIEATATLVVAAIYEAAARRPDETVEAAMLAVFDRFNEAL